MTNDPAERKPRARDDVVFRQLDDEWVLYDPTANQMHVLNLTASIVWAHCGGSMTVDEIAAKVRDAFDATGASDDVAGDVQSAVACFEREGLLQ